MRAGDVYSGIVAAAAGIPIVLCFFLSSGQQSPTRRRFCGKKKEGQKKAHPARNFISGASANIAGIDFDRAV